MTQFIMIRGTPSFPWPSGLGVRRVEESGVIGDAARDLFPGVGHRELYLLFDEATGEADSLLDEIHNRIACGKDVHETRLIQALKVAVEGGHAIACWYGGDWHDLPETNDWHTFEARVVGDASEQPPEIYARIGGTEPIGAPEDRST